MLSAFLLSFLTLLTVFAGFASSLLSDDLSPLWCSVLLVVLMGYIYWQKHEHDKIKSELDTINEKLDKITNKSSDE